MIVLGYEYYLDSFSDVVTLLDYFLFIYLFIFVFFFFLGGGGSILCIYGLSSGQGTERDLFSFFFFFWSGGVLEIKIFLGYA